MVGSSVELRGVGVLPAKDVAGVFDNGALHPETDAKERHLVFAGVFDGRDLPLDATRAKTAGNEKAVEILQGT